MINMTEERQEEQSRAAALSDVLGKLKNLDLSKDEHRSLQEVLSDMKKCLKFIREDSPEDIEEELYTMIEFEARLSYEKHCVEAKLADVQRQNKEKAEKQAAFLEEQDKHYQSRVSHLEALQNECDHFQNILTQKSAKVAGYHQQVKAETGEIAKRSQVMKRLAAKLEADKPNFSKEHKAIQSSSAELDKEISDRQKEIRGLRELITTKSKELETVKAENTSKTVELTPLRSRAESVRAMAHRENQKNLEMLSEFEAVEETRKGTIAQMEAQIADERAKYENAKKEHTNLIDRIHSEFGDSLSLEEMAIQEQAELETLDAKRFQLNERVDTICQSMQINEDKFAQLNQAKEDIWQQLDENQLNMTVFETLEENESVQPRRKRSQRGDSIDTAHSEITEPIFLLPLGLPKKSKRRQERQQQGQEEVPGNQSEVARVVRSADSSITDFGMSTFDLPVVKGQNEARDDYDRLAVFRQHFLGNSGE